MLAGKNPIIPLLASDERASFSASAGASSTNTKRWTRFMQLAGSFLLGVLLSASLCVYFVYREVRVAEQKLTAQLTQRAALPGLPPTALPKPVPDSTNPASTSSLAAPRTTAVFLQPKHVTEKDGPCALFSKEELRQILETDLTEVTSDSTGCNYKGPGRGEWVRCEIAWKGGGEALRPRRLAYQELKKRLAPENMPLQFVPNLGDEAYMTLTGTLHVRKGDVAVLFNLMWFQGLPVEKTKLLVDTAFARLE